MPGLATFKALETSRGAIDGDLFDAMAPTKADAAVLIRRYVADRHDEAFQAQRASAGNQFGG